MIEIVRPLNLHNRSCIYCGHDFGYSTPRTKEHVIGNNFVPKGSFKANDWNFFAWACDPCNHKKSELEGEISAITLQPSIGTNHIDKALGEIAEGKAKHRSETTGKTVRESGEGFNITFPLASNASVKIGFVAPPRLIPDRVKALACAHVHAFFYLITYDKMKACGSCLPGGIAWFTFTHKADWGNAQFLAFASLTKEWNGRVCGSAANSYFRIVIKRDPSGIGLWSFALEWNQNYRVIGFFGDTNAAEERVAEFPPFEWIRLDETSRVREETAIKPSEDILFTCIFRE